MTEKKATAVESVKFLKIDLLKSKTFEHRKDILTVVIGENEEVSVEEAGTRIDKFMKGKSTLLVCGN